MVAKLGSPLPLYDSNGAVLKYPVPWLNTKLPVTRQHYEWEDEYPDGMVSVEDVLKMAQQLSPAQLRYVKLRASGVSINKAIRNLRLAHAHARRWEEAPWFRPALQTELDREWGDPNYMVRPLAPLVAKVLRDALEGQLGNVVMVEMARFVFDRLYGKAPASQVTINQVQTAPTLSAITDLIRQVDAARRQVELVDVVDVDVFEVPADG